MQSADQTETSITAAAGKNNPQPLAARKQVLIVDDEQELLASIRAGLANHPRFRVLTAASGGEALGIIDSGIFDLAVIDLNMPEMDGLQLLAALSESFPEIPSIVMTGFGSPAMRQELRQAGALKVLDKPLDIETLEREITRALEDRNGCRCRLPLEIFLQLAAMEHKTIHLKVFRQDGAQGSFFFREGMLIDAEQDGLTGDSAALAMLDWQDFTLGLKEYSPPFPEPRINSRLAYLLLRTRCRLDQYGGGSACLDRAREELRRLRQEADGAERGCP
uniref:response regulator n=1 Tax=Candidatus Electronema sp. TaxID=2698783 RepID=UPI0040577686